MKFVLQSFVPGPFLSENACFHHARFHVTC